MKNDYIINGETVVVMSISSSCCRVFELDDCFDVNMSIKNIIELSCKYFGSSLNGRLDGSKYYLGYNYKLPIILDEFRDIIIFPTKSYESSENYIICYNQVSDYDKNGKYVNIYTKNNRKIQINDSFGIFENQYLKSQKLFLKLLKIKNTSLMM